MMARRLSRALLVVIALLGAVMLPASAQEGYGGTGPFKMEFTHQYLHGATYRSRFTIEGAVGIQPTGQGVGDDYANLSGYADPNGTITVTMEWIECTDPKDELQWKHVDVWMGNRYTNGDAMRGDDDQQFTKTEQSSDNSLNKVIYTFNCADFQLVDPSVRDSVLMVSASTMVQVGSSVSEVVVYLKLQLDSGAASGDGLHVKEDHDASNEKGITKYIIPGLVGSVIIGGGAAAAALGRKRKGDEEGGEEGGEGEQEQEPDWLEMEIYKDFGDRLIVGDGAEMVSACIIRHTADNRNEWVDEALTQRIQISSADQYLYVEEHGIVNGWKTAYVAAPEVEEGQPPEESIVQFVIASPEASYTNNLHFKVVKSEVKFDQENLTLPAYYEKEVKLPFTVVGIEDGTAILKATIFDGHNQETQNYTIEAAWNEKAQRYFATIRDQVLDETKDVGIAGNYLEYTIKIEARNKTGLVVEGSLPLYRYYMGLVMRMQSEVHCYLEEYNPMHHESTHKVKLPDGKEYVPAQQDCYLKLYGFDEKRNKLYVIDPKPESVTWTVKDLSDLGGAQKVKNDLMGHEGMQMGVDAALTAAGMGPMGTLVSQAHSQAFKNYDLEKQRAIELQGLLDQLGLTFEARWQTTGEGRAYYVLSCLKSVLNAPNRFDAIMEVKASYKGQTFTFARTVHMLSQPRREFASYAEQKAAHEQDNKIQEGLWEIEGGIQALGMNDRLAPLLYFIRLQQDMYNVAYGYDKRNIEAIQKVYMHMLEGKAEEDREKAAEATAADNLKWYTLEWWLQRSYEGHDYLENMSFLPRVGIAVASFGYSELAFTIPYKMKKCIEDGDGNETALDAFCVGAWEAGKAYLFELAIGFGVGAAKVGSSSIRAARAARAARVAAQQGAKVVSKAAAKEALKAGGKVTEEAMQSSWSAFGETLWTESCTGLKSWWKKQIGWEVGMAEKAIAAKAKTLFEGAKKLAGGSKYAAAEEFAKRQAIENIENLQTMIEMCHWNPTPENFRLRNQLIMKCQADKQTMMFLKTPRLLGGDPLLQGLSLKTLKKDFNGLLKTIYDVTDRRVMQDLAEEAGVSIDQILKSGATSSNAGNLAKGYAITFDRDITYYYIKNGKPHYFNQEFVERLYAKHFRDAVNTSTLPPAATLLDRSKLGPEALKRLEALEAKQAALTAKMYDQTVIEDIFGHLESYGKDVWRMVDKTLWGEALKNPAKVAQAVFHKATSRFDLADDLWSQAAAADGILKKQILEGRAVSEMMEGCRQMVKVFDIIKGRDAVRNTFPKISNSLKEAVDIIRNLDGVTKRLSEVDVALSQVGYNFRTLAEAVSNGIKDVA